jgi:sulfur carrier protein
MSKLKHWSRIIPEYDLTQLELIQYFNYNTSLLVLEYNLICNKNWSNTFIKTNDKIEIVTIVGGG